MTDRPILFSGPMVRALLDGRKTQTRRIIKGVRRDNNMVLRKATKTRAGITTHVLDAPKYPNLLRFAVGDRLWVKENAWICPPGWTDTPQNPMGPHLQEVAYQADDRRGGTAEAARDYKLKLRPSIHMPRWASRLTLIVEDVRVELLQKISETDAEAESATRMVVDDDGKFYESADGTFKCGFAGIWTHIHGVDVWDSNPWVVAVTFRVVRANIDKIIDQPEVAA